LIASLRTPHTALIAVILAAISGCGGGGSGGGDGASAAPTATSGALATDEDTPRQGTLNASDRNNDPLTYSIVTNGSLGTATITNAATGAFTYTPNPDANGSDTFSFKANDGTSDSNTATETITIVAVEDAPIAQTGTLTTNEDTAGSGALVAIDAESQPLTYSLVTNGSLGTATITNAATGAFTYTPNPDANGSDSISFRANDGLMDSNVATVTITINPVNDAPIASGACGTTPQAQTMAGTLNATDLETPASLMYSLNADGSGGIGPITTSKGATVTITNQTTGAFTYQPDTAAGDKRGKDTFDYQVTDQEGGVANATETIIVDQTIMPLGDSITAGDITATTPPVEISVGYRKPLYDTLLTAGFTFDFVGSQIEGYAVSPFDFNHEGHGGWTASEIAWGRTAATDDDGVYAWLDANPADIVLLHAGTNGLTADTDIDVEAILDEIQRWEDSAGGNHVTVVLAKIIDWVPHNPVVDEFNTNLQSMADNRIANGDDIIVVDQRNALNYQDDMGNYLHPNAIGYAKMSDVWFNALTNIVDKCP
jgi:hypothetical protein